MASVTMPATGGGTETWSTDTGYSRVDGDGALVASRPLTAAEAAWVPRAAVDQAAQQSLLAVFQDLRTLIGSVDLIRAQAEDDVDMAETRQGQIEDWQATVTNRAAAIRAAANPTAAQVKEELALACERDVAIAGQLDNIYGWRALVDQLLELLAMCVAGLARLATRTPGVG